MRDTLWIGIAKEIKELLVIPEKVVVLVIYQRLLSGLWPFLRWLEWEMMEASESQIWHLTPWSVGLCLQMDPPGTLIVKKKQVHDVQSAFRVKGKKWLWRWKRLNEPQYQDAYGHKCVSKECANGHHFHQSFQVKQQSHDSWWLEYKITSSSWICLYCMYIHIDVQVQIQASSCTPATVPDDTVAIAGLPFSVTLVRGWKSRPSLAIANSTLGIGNMEPNRLERQTQTGSNSEHLNGFSTRRMYWLAKGQTVYIDLSVLDVTPFCLFTLSHIHMTVNLFYLRRITFIIWNKLVLN